MFTQFCSINMVYQATVTPNPRNTSRNISKQDKPKVQTYVGLASDFKIRLGNHRQSFKKENLKYATELSKHIWSLKEKKINYKITWKILGRAKPYTNATKLCNLCTLEKFYIICHRDKASLNKKSELVNHCRHRDKYLLKNS